MKFSGEIGFLLSSVETDQDVWEPQIVERHYTGDILRNYRKNQPSDQINTNLRLNNQISILSDLYLKKNWPSIGYIVWDGVAWSVNTVNVDYPRLILEIGEVYNGQRPERSGEDVSEYFGK